MTLMSRLEKLERDTPGILHPDHFVTFILHSWEDEAEKREAALAQYKAEHQTKPEETFGFICYHIVNPGEISHAA